MAKLVTLIGPVKSYTGKYKFELGKANASQVINDEDAKYFAANTNFQVLNMPTVEAEQKEVDETVDADEQKEEDEVVDAVDNDEKPIVKRKRTK